MEARSMCSDTKKRKAILQKPISIQAYLLTIESTQRLMERSQEQALQANIIGLSLAADKYELIHLDVQNQTFDFTNQDPQASKSRVLQIAQALKFARRTRSNCLELRLINFLTSNRKHISRLQKAYKL
jgi:hypothetical protein